MFSFSIENYTEQTSMKTKIILFSILLLVFYSCQQEEPTEIITIKEIKAEIPSLDKFDYDTLTGLYSGDFGGSDIRIKLNYVSQTNAIGYNIHKGLQRNLVGIVERNDDTVRITLNEPGDNQYDGVFTLIFIGNDNEPAGNWTANDIKYGEKEIHLHKKMEVKYESFKNLNSNNFATYIDLLEGSIGMYYMNEDGLCRFEYYPEDENTAQLVSILGSWTFKENKLILDWQPNDFFDTPQTTYNYLYEENEDYPEPLFINERDTLCLIFW